MSVLGLESQVLGLGVGLVLAVSGKVLVDISFGRIGC